MIDIFVQFSIAGVIIGFVVPTIFIEKLAPTSDYYLKIVKAMGCEIDDVEFNQQYGLTERSLKFAKPDAIVMHPGPMNRGIEIDSKVADGPQSVILQQVTNGVAIRMAVLQQLLC